MDMRTDPTGQGIKRADLWSAAIHRRFLASHETSLVGLAVSVGAMRCLQQRPRAAMNQPFSGAD